jgi:asparagine synthase (glutamine-hydrolysing)
MCGIAGVIEKNARPQLLDAMLSRLSHRGPDGDGRWQGKLGEWTVSLGHRRLSIIDLEGGRQPLGNEDGSVQITFNGEIYNFPRMREQLLARGHHFTTRSDTEVIVHHFEDTGAAGLRDLNGMFAVGLWSQKDGSLTLARDRVGIKPLYWAPLPDGGIVFASEMSAVLEHPDIARRVDPNGLLSFFFADYVHPPHTMLQGVNKLAPGHVLTWRNGSITQPAPMWRLTDVYSTPGHAPVPQLAADLWRRTGDAVKRQMVSDVEVGVLLSGGLDSSVVAALASKVNTGALHTFSIAFEEKTFDESSYARMVANRLGTTHTEETLSEHNVIDVVERALAQLDEPLADPAFLPQYLLCELAARHVKVVLGGDGGDELWAGYPTYQAHLASPVYGAIPRLMREHLVEAAIARLPVADRYSSLEWKLKRFALRWDEDPVRRHLRWMSSTDLEPLSRALPFSRTMLPATLATPWPTDADPLNRILKLDFCTYMSGSVLTKVDRASMAHSLEVRPPLLDNELVDFAFGLPSSVKLHGLTTKYLLKQAARGHVPDAVIDRPKKGFGIPLRKWLRGPLRPSLEGVVKASPVWDLGLLDRGVFSTWLSRHVEGTEDCSKPLWALLVLDRWARRFNVRHGA